MVAGMSEVSGTPAAEAAPTGLRDFPDFLPAVLVKELRQGLRGRMFAIPFLILQGLLMICCTERNTGLTSVFWFSVTVMLVYLLPSRNLSALGEERDANTLDTLILTRLSPWRIVWGKWSATVALIALTTVAVVPYLVVRWINCGTVLWHELLLLFLLLLLGFGLTGMLTAFSLIKSPLARNALALGAGAWIYAKVCLPASIEMTQGALPSWSVTMCVLVLTAWGGSLGLIHAGNAIAPPGFELTARRRLITLAAAAACMTIFGLSKDPFAMQAFLGVVAVGSLCELSTQSSPRERHAGWSALLTKEGWDAGTLFAAALWAAVITVPPHLIFPGAGQIAGLTFLGAVMRWTLPARMRWGIGPIVLPALLSHAVANLLTLAIPAAPETFYWLLPTIRGDNYSGTESALFWMSAAVLLAVLSLMKNRSQSPARAA